MAVASQAAPWQDIASAPKKGKIDIMGKIWAPAFDEFVYERFPNCFWLDEDTMTNRRGEWVGVGKGYRPVAWMPIPAVGMPLLSTVTAAQAQSADSALREQVRALEVAWQAESSRWFAESERKGLDKISVHRFEARGAERLKCAFELAALLAAPKER